MAQAAQVSGPGQRKSPATVACTLSQVLKQLREGERIWFDSGRIGGVIRCVAARWVEVEITEVTEGAEKLAANMFAAMAWPAAGVMIVRRELAMEYGFERLAEVQEEILCACEAAHMPVLWAKRALDDLCALGRPSRAEFPDVALGVRADCVMLNSGSHILGAIHTLDDVLRRVQTRQSKKQPLLRALKAWAWPDIRPALRCPATLPLA